MLNIRILPSGDLELRIPSLSDQYELQDRLTNGEDYHVIMAELFFPYSSNGEYTYFEAGDGDPFVGLTSSPCIAESLVYTDDGRSEIEGRLWYYDKYMFNLELVQLADGDTVIYKLA